MAGTPAKAQEFPVQSKTLRNGMKVLVQSDHGIPNIALYIFYRVGSRNEHPGATAAGHDRQLEKAVEVTLDALKKNPVAIPEHPPYPTYHKK
jgi:hypothetical protein